MGNTLTLHFIISVYNFTVPDINYDRGTPVQSGLGHS